jgi:hypothetical protein
VAPFLGRPGYRPLPRPHDPPRAASVPTPPPALAGMEAVHGFLPPGALARVCQRLNLSLADVDATMTVEDVLDEVDLQAYLYDVDCPPQPAPKPSPSPLGGSGRRR